MTLTFEFPDDLVEEIEREAKLRGTDVQNFVIDATRRALDPDAALDALLDTLAGEPNPGTGQSTGDANFYGDDEDFDDLRHY